VAIEVYKSISSHIPLIITTPAIDEFIIDIEILRRLLLSLNMSNNKYVVKTDELEDVIDAITAF
jgi:hypothetical protein